MTASPSPSMLLATSLTLEGCREQEGQRVSRGQVRSTREPLSKFLSPDLAGPPRPDRPAPQDMMVLCHLSL